MNPLFRLAAMILTATPLLSVNASAAPPTAGTVTHPVVLVEFADTEFTVANPAATFASLFADGMTTWLAGNSAGCLDAHFEVLGPVKLSHPLRYYGSNDIIGDDRRPDQAVCDAMTALAATLPSHFLDKYDLDGDGTIDWLIAVMAGQSERDSGMPDAIWPHAGRVGGALAGSIRVDRYSAMAELAADGLTAGFGDAVHEYLHYLGLPYLYDTADLLNDITPGEWSVLDRGHMPYCGRSPVLLSGYERMCLGWSQPVRPTTSGHVTLTPLGSGGKALAVATSDQAVTYMLECRSQSGADISLPGSGLLVWRIDYDPDVWVAGAVNNDRSRQRVDLIEADGTADPGSKQYDAFPGPGGASSLELPGMTLRDITSAADGSVSFYLSLPGDAVTSVTADPCGSPATCFDLLGRPVGDRAATLTIGSDGHKIINRR